MVTREEEIQRCVAERTKGVYYDGLVLYEITSPFSISEDVARILCETILPLDHILVLVAHFQEGTFHILIRCENAHQSMVLLLQRATADLSDITVTGTYTCATCVIPQKKYPHVKARLLDFSGKIPRTIDLDPVGYFLVGVVDTNVKLSFCYYQDKKGWYDNKIETECVSDTAETLIAWAKQFTSQEDHLTYIIREITRALQCMSEKREYIQA